MADDLSFERVTWQPCDGCGAPLSTQYWSLGAKKVCPVCRGQLVTASRATGTTFWKAAALGLLAALAGGFVYWLVRVQFHIELGLVAIAVGYGVGMAVKKGSGGRGGRAFQILALVLTYLAITLQFLPDLPRESLPDGVGGWLASLPSLLTMAVIIPFVRGASGIIGGIIIGIALWEAWKLTASASSQLKGPFAAGA